MTGLALPRAARPMRRAAAKQARFPALCGRSSVPDRARQAARLPAGRVSSSGLGLTPSVPARQAAAAPARVVVAHAAKFDAGSLALKAAAPAVALLASAPAYAAQARPPPRPAPLIATPLPPRRPRRASSTAARTHHAPAAPGIWGIARPSR